MPLSSSSIYSVRSLTEAINALPSTPTLLRELGIFKNQPLTTTYIRVGVRDYELALIDAVPRGASGAGVNYQYQNIGNFDCLHLPAHERVLADDVQNMEAFGSNSKAQAVAELVNDKLAVMKQAIEYTREHLMLGALKGKILNADGSEIVDIYSRFGLTRRSENLSFQDKDIITVGLEALKRAGRAQRKGETVTGWAMLCAPDFFDALIGHKSVRDVYLRYQEAAQYHKGFDGQFETAGIKFFVYDYEFPSGNKVEAGKAIMFPLGTMGTFREYFAPANMNETVNTRALPFYASKEKLDHGKGWDLEAQSNPLPLVLRPNLVCDVEMQTA